MKTMLVGKKNKNISTQCAAKSSQFSPYFLGFVFRIVLIFVVIILEKHQLTKTVLTTTMSSPPSTRSRLANRALTYPWAAVSQWWWTWRVLFPQPSRGCPRARWNQCVNSTVLVPSTHHNCGKMPKARLTNPGCRLFDPEKRWATVTPSSNKRRGTADSQQAESAVYAQASVRLAKENRA